MRTMIKMVKLAVLDLGFFLLFSCTGDLTQSTAPWKSSRQNTFFHKNSVEENSSTKVSIGVLPIFIGTIEATLAGN